MSRQQADTRVTAYVFGELSPAAAAAFERELDQSNQLQAEVAAIRETIGVLKGEFESRATTIGASQRKTIERAIDQRSSTDVSRSVVLDSQTGSVSRRRMLASAALAASILIVCGLAYPHLRDRATISLRENTKSTTAAELSSNAGGAPEKDIAELVKSFNDLMRDSRFEEAAGVARRVSDTDPDNPISVTMLQASRMGQQSLKEAETDLAFAAPTESLFESIESPLSIETRSAQPTSNALSGPPAPVADELAPARVENQGLGVANQELKPHGGEVASQSASKIEDPFDFGMQPKNLRDSLSVSSVNESVEFEMDNDRDGVAVTGAQRPRTRSRRFKGMEQDMTMGMEMEMMMDMDAMDIGGAMGGMGGGDRYEPIEDNPFVNIHQSSLSTFSIDVDTAAYAKIRLLLNQNALPHANAVRIEELLNYFDYDYPAPQDDHPFAASMEIAACPWNQKHRLARVGIKGREIQEDRPSSNLVFLLDVSGSMDEPNKLPLVVDGMKMLTSQLTENDKVAIVVYAGAAGLVLDATRGDKKQQIVAALERLKAGGSTNGGEGILLAYELARDNFIVGGTNRVILCSDGDFNVGVTSTDELVKIAQQNAKSNIFLSVLGFGTGNHNDAMMEDISNKGNGNYAFIDSKAEAKKVLVEELGGTLVTIAKDVKIQIEFNPKQVAAYRLIGYENRMLEAQDFGDDKKDAGEIGAGHTVTALYELIPPEPDDAGVDGADVPPVDELRYQERSRLSERADSGESLVLKLRYKQPESDTSTLMEIAVTDSGKRFSQTDRDFKFAAAVAAFGMLLRDSPHKGNMTFAGVERIAREGAKGDDFGYRSEFVSLVSKATELSGHEPQ